MKCVCPMGGDRTCPKDCPIAVWASLSPKERKAQRKAIVERLYNQGHGLTQAQIATQLGVSQQTISDDLAGLPETGKPPRPKGGRPKGSKPKPKPKPETPQTDRAYEAIVKAQSEGQPIPPKKEFAKALGVSHMAMEKGWDRVHQEQEQAATTAATEDRALAEATFSEKSKLTVKDAIRIHKTRLDKEFERRVNEEVRRRIDEADNLAREENKRLRREKAILERMLGDNAVFTKAQFRQMQMLCHPDNSASLEVRNALSQILVEKERRLVKPDGARINGHV